MIDVSIGIKIIENHQVKNGEFKYNFNGGKVITKKAITVIKDESTSSELQQMADMYEKETQKVMAENEVIGETNMTHEQARALIDFWQKYQS